MGCDIHLFVETRDGEGAPWKLTPVLWRCTWCKGSTKNREGGPCGGCFGTGQKAGFGDRNYSLFGILAGVRNDNLESIADERGLPDDLSEELTLPRTLSREHRARLRELHGAGSLGDHSHSWLMLRELLEFDWQQKDGDKTYAELVDQFHSGFIPALVKLGNPDNVRIVFGFDS